MNFERVKPKLPQLALVGRLSLYIVPRMKYETATLLFVLCWLKLDVDEK